MHLPTRFLITTVFAATALNSFAQQPASPPTTIKVEARKNPGDLPYRFFWRGQNKIRSYLAPEPRLVDMLFRVSFTELPEPERDAYEPRSWGVSVVSASVDENLKLRRGGYFELPDLPTAYSEDATIMFKEQSRKRVLDVGWVLRVGPDRRLGYDDLGKALAEVRAAQGKMSVLDLSLRAEKWAKYDGIKACFVEPGGSVQVAGKPVADATVGDCSILKFDPARAGSGQALEFTGPLDIVTIVETGDYLKAQPSVVSRSGS